MRFGERIGRNHVYVKHTLEDKTKIEALAFDMCDYAQQTVDLYKAITKTEKVKNASTPFLPEGSLLPQDEEVTGELAGNAAKILMKALWLARLGRSTTLPRGCSGGRAPMTSEYSGLYSTCSHRYTTVSSGTSEMSYVRLRLYVDADFAGETRDAKSSSGGYLVLIGKRLTFP